MDIDLLQKLIKVMIFLNAELKDASPELQTALSEFINAAVTYTIDEMNRLTLEIDPSFFDK